jgi:hypothetical protein
MKGILMLVILTCFSCRLLPKEPFLARAQNAIAAHNIEEVRDLLDQHGPLAHYEKEILISQAELSRARIKELLDNTSSPFYNLALGFTLLPLSSYLIYRQIPRLQGTAIEYNSPCLTYAGAGLLTAIGALGEIVEIGAILSAMRDIYQGVLERRKYLKGALAQASSIVPLISDTRY